MYLVPDCITKTIKSLFEMNVPLIRPCNQSCFIFAAFELQSKNLVQPPVKCATTRRPDEAVHVQLCNCAMLCNVRIHTPPSVRSVQMRRVFSPAPRGNNSRLRGENEHLAWRQEPVRMARSPPKLARHSIATVLPQCHSIATKVPQWHLAGAGGNFASPQNLWLDVGELTAF